MSRKTPERSDWGSPKEVRPGVWRIRYWAGGEDGYRRRSRTIRGSRRDANAELARLRVAYSDDAPVPTIGQAWSLYTLPYYVGRVEKDELARSTLTSYKSRWRAHVEPRWGSTAADHTRALDMQRWFDSLPYRTAVDCNKILRRTYQLLVKYHPGMPNVMLAGYDMPSRQHVNEQDRSPWLPEELARMWRGSRGSWIEGGIILRGYGGCRPGESLAIRGTNVRGQEHGGVTVACVAVSGQVLANGRLAAHTKNAQSTRTALVAGEPARRLLELAQEAGEGFIVSESGGDHSSQYRFNQEFFALLAKQGIVRHPAKNLRKTWETAVRWQMRLPPWLTEPIMGHALPGVTSAWYDMPSIEVMAATYAEGYRRYPFGGEAV